MPMPRRVVLFLCFMMLAAQGRLAAQSIEAAAPSVDTAVQKFTRVSFITSGPTSYVTRERQDPPRVVLEFPEGVMLGQLDERIDVSRGYVREILCEYSGQPPVALGQSAIQPIRSITLMLSEQAPWRVVEERGQIVIEIGLPTASDQPVSVNLEEAARLADIEAQRRQTMDTALSQPMAPKPPQPMPWSWVTGIAVSALGLLGLGAWALIRLPARGVWEVGYDFPDAQSVSIVGEFNNWDPSANPLQRDSSGRWSRRFRLDPGWYEYRLVVDGQWVNDPNASDRVENPFGSQNNIVEIR